MKSIGMARKIDHLGRIVLPSELRRLFGISEGDYLEISVDGSKIVLNKLEERCTFCGSANNVTPHMSKMVCASCRSELSMGSPGTTDVPADVPPAAVAEMLD
jgi:transcriptional pleiotropic regulator of transition state genes